MTIENFRAKLIVRKKCPFLKLRHSFQLLFFFILFVVTGCQKSTGLDFAEDALSTFELEPGFKMELVAAEPLISDPVDMEIDENGRMYVVEMHGYPLDKSGTGKVKLLSDTDGDGRMDKSTVFADSLVLPTGIMRWKKGVLVTDAPNLLYLEDTDGDGKSDIRIVMLTGFALSNPQHNFNSPLLGLDNWIYLGNEGTVTTSLYKEEFGDQGKEVFYPSRPDGPRLPANAGGLNVRFRPDRHELELLASKTQFGQTFDAWGRHFLVTNSNHIYQEVIKAPYLNRNPYLPVSDATQSLSDHGNAADVFPITEDPEYQLLTNIGVFTAASGITAYLGGAFPAEYKDATFVAESVGNLVHADRLEPRGASFTASRILENKEFLASTDSWFRPVNLYIGPEGALYVVDYYRQIIEHPEWMAEEDVKSGVLYNGTNQGRIYRISPSGAKPITWTRQLELGNATDEQLVEKLAHPNIWWRQNAQRLLVDRNSDHAVPALVQMAQNSTSPLGRLHALWTLEGLDQLTSILIEEALRDPVAGMRENAIKLAELHLDDDSSLTSKLLKLQDDEDPKVRYQLLCTLGFIDSPKVNHVRQQLLFKDIEDHWVQTAALTASSSKNDALLHAVLERFQKNIPVYASLTRQLSAMAVNGGQYEKVRELLEKATTSEQGKVREWQAYVLQGLAGGLKSRKATSGLQINQSLLVEAFFDHPSPPVRDAALEILQVTGLSADTQSQAVMRRARQMAGDAKLSAVQRAQAIRLLALGNPAPLADFLKGLIDPGEPVPVQRAALETLSAISGEMVSHFVLQRWSSFTPEIRDVALNTFMSSRDRVELLLDAVEEGKIQAAHIGWPRSVSLMIGRWPRSTKLMTQADLELRDRARNLLTRKDERRRKDVIQEYRSTLDLKGDPEQGRIVFRQNCAVCHQMGDRVGMPFGPDLTTIRNRRPATIMNDILDPNLSIADGFDFWIVELKSGETVQGVISTETPVAINLLNAGGVEKTIPRSDIKSLRELDMSAMPSGLEKQISRQEMADLLAYIRGR